MDFSKNAADILAIQDLIAAYAYHFDRFDGPAWAETFTEDGEHITDLEGVKPIRGRAALRQIVEASAKQVSGVIHVTSTQRVLAIDGNDAIGHAYFYVKGKLKNGGSFFQAGRYDDIYRKTADGWKFSRRTEVNLLPAEYIGFDLSQL